MSEWYNARVVYTSPSMKVIAIIPAAGLGTRMGAAGVKKSTPKQFLQVGGIPVLLRTLRAFAAVETVSEIIVALPQKELAQFAPELKHEAYSARVRLVAGGDSRQSSVWNAMQLAQAAENDIVLVHDGVRPFAGGDLISKVIAAVKKHGAAIAGTPAVDTVKQVERTADGAIVTSTIPRERVVMAQTPQGARFGLMRRAFEDAESVGFNGTDEASLLERIGVVVHVVMGSARNIKLTTPADLELAEMFLASERKTS